MFSSYIICSSLPNSELKIIPCKVEFQFERDAMCVNMTYLKNYWTVKNCYKHSKEFVPYFSYKFFQTIIFSLN